MTLRKEVIGGITTFLTMAYILAVNPSILSATGMDAGAVFTTTCISAVVATLVMALYAKLPFALVGVMMMHDIRKVDFSDYVTGISCFVCRYAFL